VPSRVLIADDHALLRMAIGSMLGSEEDLEVVGEATDGQEALDLCRELRPDLVLMDVSMPAMDGIAATRAIKAEFPTTGVLMLTAHADENLLLEAVRAGAAGYVLKTASPHDLLAAVRGTLAGESHVDQGLVMKLVRRLVDEDGPRATPPSSSIHKGPQGAPDLSLTLRELEVLRLLAEGKTNRQISEDLYLSLSTVKRHLERIISKLEVSDRTQAAVRALELGFIEHGKT
jgi:two-component system, NarL family, response regulator LiaR